MGWALRLYYLTNLDDIAPFSFLCIEILIFILPSEEECDLAPEENLEPKSAGLEISRTREVWHTSLEVFHAQIKEKSLLGCILCSEETQRKIVESDIFRIL